jgi:hypothetical protein
MQPIETERQLIAYIADRNKRGQAARKAGEPEVGIFFVYNGEVVIDSKPTTLPQTSALPERNSYRTKKSHMATSDEPPIPSIDFFTSAIVAILEP